MKKRINRLIVVIGCLIAILLLSSCGNQGNNNTSNKTDHKNSITYYYDSNEIKINDADVTIDVNKYQVGTSQNYALSVRFSIVNNNYDDKDFEIRESIVKSETTNVEYNATTSLADKITLKYGINHNYSLSATLPSSILEDKYQLIFECIDTKYIIFLYERPDELREEYTIKFNIQDYLGNNTIAKEIKVLDGKTASALKYIWEDNTKQYYCDTWHTTTDVYSTSNIYNWNSIIKGDIVLYGIQKSILNYSVDNNMDMAWINGINYEPIDKIIVVKQIKGKVYLSNYVFYDKNNIEEVYLPRGIDKIYNANFTHMASLNKIHYAGTEEEWNAIEKTTSIPTTIQMIFNSTYTG